MKRKIIDTKYKFISVFDPDTGSYLRTGFLDEEGKDTGQTPSWRPIRT